MTVAATPINVNTNQSSAVVAAGVGLALTRLTPLMASRGIRADVAVHPDLLVRMCAGALADLLEQLFAAAIHHARAGRIVVTAVHLAGRVAISVTDGTAGADPDAQAGSVRALTDNAALHGATLNIQVRPDEGTTMTLSLVAAPDHTGTTASPTASAAPMTNAMMRVATNRSLSGTAGAA